MCVCVCSMYIHLALCLIGKIKSEIKALLEKKLYEWNSEIREWFWEFFQFQIGMPLIQLACEIFLVLDY